MAIAARVKTTIMTAKRMASPEACVCFCAEIRTVCITLDLAKALFRRIQATAALAGSSVKHLIVQAIEHEVTQSSGVLAGQAVAKPVRGPLIHLRRGQKLDLTGFDLDDLLT